MKSRWTIYLLLAIVVAVWGVVVWKIFIPEKVVLPSATPLRVKVAMTIQVVDTLRLDYPDPFLKKVSAQVAVIPRSVVRNLPSLPAIALSREKVRIAHLGTVSTAGKELYILTVEDIQYEIRHSEYANDFKLIRTDKDSIYLCKTEIIYGVKRCE